MLAPERKSMAWALVISVALGFVSHTALAQDGAGGDGDGAGAGAMAGAGPTAAGAGAGPAAGGAGDGDGDGAAAAKKAPLAATAGAAGDGDGAGAGPAAGGAGDGDGDGAAAAKKAPLAPTAGADGDGDGAGAGAMGPSPTVAPRVSSGSSKKIAVVSDTLKDILQSVQNEEKAETAIYNKYQTWCVAETASIDDDLSKTKTALANAKVNAEEEASTIDALKLLIKKSEKESGETKDAMQQAEALRKEESDEYEEEMQTNAQSIRQIDAAIKSVGKVQKQGGFLQGGVVKKLQLNQPGETSYIFGVMKGLRNQLTKASAELKSVEDDKVAGYDELMVVKKGEEKALGGTTTEKKIVLTEIIGSSESTKRKIAKLSKEIEELKAREIKTAERCQTTQEEWKVRQKDRTEEKATLKEAIRFLKEISLEQSSSVKHRQVHITDEEHASVVFAPSYDGGATSFLQHASTAKLSGSDFFTEASAALMGEDDEINVHMRKDTFKGVKSVVTKLITSHEDNQKDDRSTKEYCEKEIEAKDDEKADTANELAAVKANIDKKSSKVDMLKDEIKMLGLAQVAMEKSLKDAGEVRKEEHAVYKSGSKDRALATKVLNQAMTVMQQQFSKKSALVQQNKWGGPPSGLPPAKQKTSAGFGVMSMVQDIIDDIAKEQRDVTIAEENAKVAFEQLQKDTQQSWDDKQQDITDRVEAKAKLGVQIGTLKETQTEKTDDLAAIMMQLDSLHKECDALLLTYDQRKKARSFEVSQLKDVMDILSGSTMAVRTGLMQDENDEDADGTSALDGK